jgi:hypothetical protein
MTSVLDIIAFFCCFRQALNRFDPKKIFGRIWGFLSKMKLFCESSFTNDRLTSVIAMKPKGLITGIHRR